MKPNLLIPMAGLGQRFVNQGFHMPKPLIMVDNQHIIDWSFKSINYQDYNLIFITRKEQCNYFGLDDILKQKFGEDITIIKLDSLTEGTVCSCLYAEQFIDNESPLVIYTLDVYFEPSFNINKINKEDDGHILVFKSNNKAYSYAELNHDNYVIRTAEKDVISENAAVGIYYFKHGSTFVQKAKEMISKNLRTNNEFYVSPLYNLLIEDDLKISVSHVDKMYLMGTPEELSFFQKNINIKFGQKPIALCCDHSGYELLQLLKKILKQKNIPYIDFGTYIKKDCDYFDYVNQAVKAIQSGQCDFGIGSCRTGQGVNQCSNKFPGIRSSLIFDEYTAEMAVRHNCSNFFSLPEKYIDENLLDKIIDTIVDNSFDGGRFIPRVQKIEKINNEIS
jgi:RpiB/LacA/LacB family sugar-phosphate isomerase